MQCCFLTAWRGLQKIANHRTHSTPTSVPLPTHPTITSTNKQTKNSQGKIFIAKIIYSELVQYVLEAKVHRAVTVGASVTRLRGRCFLTTAGALAFSSSQSWSHLQCSSCTETTLSPPPSHPSWKPRNRILIISHKHSSCGMSALATPLYLWRYHYGGHSFVAGLSQNSTSLQCSSFHRKRPPTTANVWKTFYTISLHYTSATKSQGIHRGHYHIITQSYEVTATLLHLIWKRQAQSHMTVSAIAKTQFQIYQATKPLSWYIRLPVRSW